MVDGEGGRRQQSSHTTPVPWGGEKSLGDRGKKLAEEIKGRGLELSRGSVGISSDSMIPSNYLILCRFEYGR